MFRGKLFAPNDLHQGTWPSVGELLGKIILVLSGSYAVRNAYRYTFGNNPGMYSVLIDIEMDMIRSPLINIHPSS